MHSNMFNMSKEWFLQQHLNLGKKQKQHVYINSQFILHNFKLFCDLDNLNFKHNHMGNLKHDFGAQLG